LELFSNLGEIIEGGAEGVLVEPKMSSKFVVQAMLKSEFAQENWQPVYISEKARQWVKLYHSCRVDGMEYVVPTDAKICEIGSVIGTGNTIEEAERNCLKWADDIGGFGIKANTQAIQTAKEELAKA
jgi:hypothetical protein